MTDLSQSAAIVDSSPHKLIKDKPQHSTKRC